jgi:hypothetical protein
MGCGTPVTVSRPPSSIRRRTVGSRLRKARPAIAAQRWEEEREQARDEKSTDADIITSSLRHRPCHDRQAGSVTVTTITRELADHLYPPTQTSSEAEPLPRYVKSRRVTVKTQPRQNFKISVGRAEFEPSWSGRRCFLLWLRCRTNCAHICDISCVDFCSGSAAVPIIYRAPGDGSLSVTMR